MPPVDDLPPPNMSREAFVGISDLPPPPSTPKTGAGQSALEHFGNAAALGYLPQLQAITSQLTPDPDADVDRALTAKGIKIEQPKSTYVSDRDATVQRLRQEEQDHPYASAGGSIGGALAGGAAMSGLTPINAASRFGRVMQAAKGGAIIGAASNPGDTEGVVDPTQGYARIADAAGGAALGGVAHGAIEGLSSAAVMSQTLPGALQSKAEERAFKASGAMLRDYRKAYGQDRINELGRFALDNGLVKPGMAVDDVAEAASNLADTKGKALGKVIDELGAQEATSGGQIARGDLTDEVRNRLIQEGNLPSVVKNNKYFSGLADKLESTGVKNLSISALQDLKNTAKNQINWDRLPGADIPIEEQFNRAVFSTTKDAIEHRAGELAEDAGRTDYTQLKKDYGNATDLARIAKDQALRQSANRFFSPTDYASGGAGAIIGAATGGDTIQDKLKGALVGGSVGLVNKAARGYGTPLVSMGLDKAGSFLAKSTPISAIGEAIAPITDIAKRSPLALASTEGMMSRVQPAVAPLRNVANSPAQPQGGIVTGPDRWATQGIQKLGIQDPELTKRLLSDPRAKSLLIHASDLPAGSKAMKNIQNQIQKGWGQ